MLVTNESADRKLSSSNNLINRLRNGSLNSKPKNAMSLFIAPAQQSIQSSVISAVPKVINPFEKPLVPVIAKQENPSVEHLLEEVDVQVKLGLAHNKALDVLTKAVNRLEVEVDSISINKLPQVITATSKVVEGIRKERLERDKIGKDKEVHYHFYTPQQKTLNDYEVIDVTP